MMKIIALLLSATVVLATQQTALAEELAYPENYRDWKHVKSMVLGDEHPLADPFAGIHHIYANEAALSGLDNGEYADGATFVFDLLAANEADSAITEGERKLLGVMLKDREAFKTTGGWGFEGFAGNSQTERLVKDGGSACYACHTSRAAQDYVFTEARD